MKLENKTNGTVAAACFFRQRHAGDILPGQLQRTAIRFIQQAKHMQQRAFTHAGRPHNNRHLSLRNFQVDAFQHLHFLRTSAITFENILRPDGRCLFIHSEWPPRE